MDRFIPILSTSAVALPVAIQPHSWREAEAVIPHIAQIRAHPHHPHPLLLLLNHNILILYA